MVTRTALTRTAHTPTAHTRTAVAGLVVALTLLTVSVGAAQGVIGPITFAAGEADGEPVDPTASFAAGTEIVYAFFDFTDLVLTDLVSGVWYYQDTAVISQAYSVTQLLGRHMPTGNLFFSLVLEDGAQAGQYRLDIGLNGQPVQSAEFTVAATGADAEEPRFDEPGLSTGFQADGTLALMYAYPAGDQDLYLAVTPWSMAAGTPWGWRVSREGTVIAEAAALTWDAATEGIVLVPLDVSWEEGIYDLDLFLKGVRASTASVTIGDAEPANSLTTHQDDFAATTSGWPTDENPAASSAYVEDRFVIAITGVNASAWSVHDTGWSDGIVEVDASTIGGPADNAYGVIVRFQDEANFHAFLASADGYYAAIHFIEGALVWDQPWTADEPFGPLLLGNDTNRLRVLAQGRELRFYVNGRFVLLESEAQWSEGRAGLFAASLSQPGVEVAFDDWQVWALPGGAP